MHKIENWNRQYDSIIHIGKDGTIKEDLVIKPNEKVVIQEDNKRNLTNEQIDIISSKSELKRYTTDLGGYIHMCYINNELLFNRLDIDKANISRLIYLATYIDYNDRQENLLIDCDKFNQEYPMTRRDIQYKLKLSDVSFRRFMADMKRINLIYEVNKKIYMNPDYFSKGKSSFKNKDYTRIFIDTTRTLYEGSSPRQHKQLSYIFQLIPFIHYETNIICRNPNSMDLRNCGKMSLLEICKLLGISCESSNASRLESDLLKFTIAKDGEKFHIFKRVIVKGGNGKFDYFVINPQVVWSGKNLNRAKETIECCFFVDDNIDSTLSN